MTTTCRKLAKAATFDTEREADVALRDYWSGLSGKQRLGRGCSIVWAGSQGGYVVTVCFHAGRTDYLAH